MWLVQNHTPFSAAAGFVLDGEARKHWVVAIRGTFEFEDSGRLIRARQQLPVARVPAYHGSPGQSSMRYDSDITLSKAATDVILDGHARAPSGRAVERLDVALRVGPIQKTATVHGPRTWIRKTGEIVPGPAKPFLKAPLQYEHAFGGMDPAGTGGFALNPVGTGYTTSPQLLVNEPAPTLDAPGCPVTRAGDLPQRVGGFGALAPHWPARARHAGTYNEQWRKERAPLWPEDFDPQFFQVAPGDQRVRGGLRGGELCVLKNLARNPELHIKLPAITIAATTHIAREAITHPATIQTLYVEPDASRITLVWCATLECHDREHRIERSRIVWEGEQTWAEQSQ